MIPARLRRLYLNAPLAISLAVTATQAHADVLELGGDGARWVAGGPVGNAHGHAGVQSIEPLTIPQVPDNFDAPAIPEAIVGDTRLHAAAIPQRYIAKVSELSQRYDLSPALLEALVWQESRWRENAVSHAGARGLAQLMPGTARYLGVNPDDPMQNLEGGARYLREQLDRFDQNLEKALAAYNAGPGRVIRANGVPNIPETRAYVAAIMGRLASHSRPLAAR